MTKKTQPATWE